MPRTRLSCPAEVAACIARRLELAGAGLTAEQLARLVRVVAAKERWEKTPMTTVGRARIRDGYRKCDTVQEED